MFELTMVLHINYYTTGVAKVRSVKPFLMQVVLEVLFFIST